MALAQMGLFLPSVIAIEGVLLLEVAWEFSADDVLLAADRQQAGSCRSKGDAPVCRNGRVCPAPS